MTRGSLAKVVLAALLALTACSDSKAPSAASASAFDPFATNASSTSAGPVARPNDLAVGDCFDSDQFAPGLSIDPRGVHVVACTDPHQHEVYAIERDTDPPGTPFPGDASLSTYAGDVCLADFAPALGVDYKQSRLDFAIITPDATSWSDGDRSVICVVHDTDFAELTGSQLATTTSTTTNGSAASTASDSLAPKSG